MCSVLSAGLATPATSSRANRARRRFRTSSNPPPRVGPASSSSPLSSSRGKTSRASFRVGSSRRSSRRRAPPLREPLRLLVRRPSPRRRRSSPTGRARAPARRERPRRPKTATSETPRSEASERGPKLLPNAFRSCFRTRSGPRTVRGEENQRARRRFPRERARDQPVRAFVSARESVGSVGRAWFRESHSESESRARGVGHVLHGQTELERVRLGDERGGDARAEPRRGVVRQIRGFVGLSRARAHPRRRVAQERRRAFGRGGG